MTIGIFGGSFNPIHNGHIQVALAARRQAHLQQVWMMVSPQNPLKQPLAQPFAMRYHLTRIAVHGIEGLQASAFEATLPTPSYTYHTLQALREQYPHLQFALIIGHDNWQHFDQWYRYADILRSTPIIVYPRHDDGHTHTDMSHTGNTPFLTADMPTPTVLRGDFFDVSSTEIRRRIKKHEDIATLTPQSIQPLITRLYS